jgi:hypothetical protein
MSPQQNTENTDFDNPWKVVIELYFREFLLFFFPWIEAEIDWDKPIQFLDKELQKIVRDANTPKNYADKLIQVHRKDGQKALVIIHAEVQSQEENIFPSRMYTYNYRLRDRYNCPVVSQFSATIVKPGGPITTVTLFGAVLPVLSSRSSSSQTTPRIGQP